MCRRSTRENLKFETKIRKNRICNVSTHRWQNQSSTSLQNEHVTFWRFSMNIGPGTMELVPENPQLNYEPEKWSCYCSKCVLGHLMCNLLHTGHINMDLVPKKPQEHHSQSECSCSLTKMRFNSSFVQKNIYNLHWTFGVRAWWRALSTPI